MSCPEFVAKSLAMRTAVHLAHLTTKSYAAHVALNEFYDGIVDPVDRLAEIHLAEKPDAVFPSIRVPDYTDMMRVFAGYLSEVRKELKDEAEHKAKENIITEIEELTLSTIYKLKRFS